MMRQIDRVGDLESAGRQMHTFMEELFPIGRSITGDGVRETFSRIATRIPLEVTEVPSGTEVLDWTIPREWNVRDAYVKDPSGQKVIDFQRSNLHLVGYSRPVDLRLSLGELKEHLHTLPEHPDWIPYRTSYYSETWGFCLEHNRMLQLQEGEYEVVIDSALEDGNLTYAECLLPGATEDEVLVSCHSCHPSLANDNLAGLALATFLAGHISRLDLKYSYRFVFGPGTIGPVTWLARNERAVARIKHGLVVTCVGDPGPPTYKKSRRGDALIDRAAEHVLSHWGEGSRVLEFSPYGYDERQYCSPGFDLAVGCLMRSPNDGYPEYHSSADDLSLVQPEYLADSLRTYLRVLDVVENDGAFINLSPKGEPQLGKRGLYPSVGAAGVNDRLMALLWVLNQSDGRHRLLDIADRSGLPFATVREAAEDLVAANLLTPSSN